MKKPLLITACLLSLGSQVYAQAPVPPTAPVPHTEAEEKAYHEERMRWYESEYVKWEEDTRNAIPRTKPVIKKALELVFKANALLRGDDVTCAQMRDASDLLDKADDVYDNSNAKEAGDDTMDLVYRRSVWLDHRVQEGKCKK